MTKKELTPQQLLFIATLIEMGFQRAGPAYMVAYPSSKPSAADASASQLLKNPKVKEQIEKHLNEILSSKKKFLEHEIFNFWYVRMSYDPTEIIDLNGQLVMSTEELRRRGLHVVIDSINKKYSNKGQTYVEYKLADRDKAAERLDAYIHMTKPFDASVEGKDGQGNPFNFSVSFVKPKGGKEDEGE